MKFICEKNEFLRNVNIVSKAVSIKSPVSILEGIYIKAADGHLTLYGNDGTLYIRCSIEANVSEQGEIVIPARLFEEILSKSDECSVTVHTEENSLIMQCGHSLTTLCYMEAAEYPLFPSYNSTNSAVMFSSQLVSMIDQTAFATSVSEDKPILTGILLEFGTTNARMVALDGYRLALRQENIQSVTGITEAVVPSRSMREIARILPSEEQTAKLYCSNNLVTIICGDIEIATRVLSGDYVKYKNILPTEHNTRITVNKKSILDSLERASIIARQSKANLINLKLEEETMTITSDSEIGKAKEEVSIDLKGKSLDISFNFRYLLDVLKEVADDSIVMDFNTSISPCMIHPLHGDSFLYLVLPVKTSNA